eukprot:TRINITY_DN16240_c0_g1_i1.p1 TRINITY_DN16240_c0_g1~~TRINITY_DN16240_c0_g1_i1.p1  ORF type:complete len:298 (+),score=43.03 TRINITY_DN16240_c0_g1_i1:83-976(+)
MMKVNDSDVELAPAEASVTVQRQSSGFTSFLSGFGRVTAGLLGCGVLVLVCRAASFPALQSASGSAFSSAVTSAISLDQLPWEGSPERALATTENSNNEDADLWPGWPCAIGEEILFGKCYRTCANLTDNKLPFRAGACTCCQSIDCLNSSVPSETDCSKFNLGANGLWAHEPFLPDCPYENEELYEGLCYSKCSLLTMGKYALRTGVNTCSGDKYKSNWTVGLGFCSGFGIGGTKCMPHIPKAARQGFPQPGKTPGKSPLGISDWPKLNQENVRMVKGMISDAQTQVSEAYKKIQK